MIPNELIEKALALTGKTIENVESEQESDDGIMFGFSSPLFCFYLLSLDFILAYQELDNYRLSQGEYVEEFGKAIHEYQKGNPKLLIDLLSKI